MWGVLAREPTRAPSELTWRKQSYRSVNLRHRIQSQIASHIQTARVTSHELTWREESVSPALTTCYLFILVIMTSSWRWQQQRTKHVGEKKYIINTEVHCVVRLCITDLTNGRKMENIKIDTNISFLKKIVKLSPNLKIKKIVLRKWSWLIIMYYLRIRLVGMSKIHKNFLSWQVAYGYSWKLDCRTRRQVC
jgi:hypothetical protein